MSGMVTERFTTISLPALLIKDGRQPHDKERERSKQEGRAQDRADAYLAGGGPAGADNHGPQDGDDRDHGLGQRRPNGCEDASHGPVTEPQAVAQDFDRVGEQHRRAEYGRQGEDQLNYRHMLLFRSRGSGTC
jgi:hypothetical protein